MQQPFLYFHVFWFSRMSFSEVIQGTASSCTKLAAIQSSWETEFRRKMTDKDKTDLTKRFTVEETHKNLQKVFI